MTKIESNTLCSKLVQIMTHVHFNHVSWSWRSKHWTKPSPILGTISFEYCFQIKVNIWTTSFMHLLHRHHFYFYSISLLYIILTLCSSLNYPLLFSYHLIQSISLATGYNNTYVYKKINKFELPIIKGSKFK